MLQNLVTILLKLFQKKEIKIPKSPEENPPKKEELKTLNINWKDSTCKISKYFTVGESCWLPSWSALHYPSEVEQQNILLMAEKMDKVREFVNKPIRVHCWIRPVLNNPGSAYHEQDYNKFKTGARLSAHREGKAVDWSCVGITCDELRELLKPKLEEFDLRMEDLPKSNWVHLGNDYTPNKTRYFKP